jgi:hypothetical protein
MSGFFSHFLPLIPGAKVCSSPVRGDQNMGKNPFKSACCGVFWQGAQSLMEVASGFLRRFLSTPSVGIFYRA